MAGFARPVRRAGRAPWGAALTLLLADLIVAAATLGLIGG